MYLIHLKDQHTQRKGSGFDHTSELLLEPNFLLPRKQPNGPLKLRYNHSMARNIILAFCFSFGRKPLTSLPEVTTSGLSYGGLLLTATSGKQLAISHVRLSSTFLSTSTPMTLAIVTEAHTAAGALIAFNSVSTTNLYGPVIDAGIASNIVTINGRIYQNNSAGTGTINNISNYLPVASILTFNTTEGRLGVNGTITSVSAFTYPTLFPNKLNIGSLADFTPSLYAGCRVLAAFFWDRLFSNEEMISWMANPYQFLEPG